MLRVGYFQSFKSYSKEIWLIMIAIALYGIGWSFVTVLLNLHFAEIGISKSDMGDILGASSLGMILVAIPAAVLFDRINARYVFISSTVCWTISMMLGTLAQTKAILVIAALLLGAAYGVHFVIIGPFLIRYTFDQARIDAFGIIFAVETIAGIFGNLLAGHLPHFLKTSTNSGNQYALLIGAGIVATAILPLSNIPRTQSHHFTFRPIKTYFISQYHARYLQLIIPGAVTMFGAGILIPFLNLFLKERLGFGPDQIGNTFAKMNFFMMLGILLGPPFGRRWGLLKPLLCSRFLSIGALISLTYTASAFWAVIALIARTTLMNMATPLEQAFRLNNVPETDKASMNSHALILSNITFMLGVLLGGRIIDQAGFNAAIFSTAGIYTLSLLLMLFLWVIPKLRAD